MIRVPTTDLSKFFAGIIISSVYFEIVRFSTKDLPNNNWSPNSDLLPIEGVMKGYNPNIVC